MHYRMTYHQHPHGGYYNGKFEVGEAEAGSDQEAEELCKKQIDELNERSGAGVRYFLCKIERIDVAEEKTTIYEWS